MNTHRLTPAAQAARRIEWSRVRRVLAVRLDQIGDVLMTSPALAALKRGTPNRHVTLLTSHSGALLAPHLPVDEAIGAAAPWLKSADALDGAGCLELAQRLRTRAFDAAVIFTVYSQSALPAALLCLLAGIERRLGFCRENPYHLLTDWVPEDEPQQRIRHEVERQLALVRHVGFDVDDERLRFALRGEDHAGLRRALAARGLSLGRPYIVLHPGATAPARRYPPESFGAALRRLARRVSMPVFITGLPQERALADTVKVHAGQTDNVHDLTGLLSLGQLAALIAGARVLISNNSGPVHLAAALGTPVVDLYALTNPQHTPWRVPNRVLFHDVPCRYCMKSECPQGHHACLRRVDPADVADAAAELLADKQLAAIEVTLPAAGTQQLPVSIALAAS